MLLQTVHWLETFKILLFSAHLYKTDDVKIDFTQC